MLVDTFFMAMKVKFVGEIFRANLTIKFRKFGAKFFTVAYLGTSVFMLIKDENFS
jgi:hypothetical protein